MTSGDFGEQGKGPDPLPENLHVDINSATAEQWAGLPGSSPDLAAKIITLREENGGFASIDDLARVVDDALLDHWRPALHMEAAPAEQKRPRAASPRQPLPFNQLAPLPLAPHSQRPRGPVGLTPGMFGGIPDPQITEASEPEPIIVGIRYRMLVITLLITAGLVAGVRQLHAFQMHRNADRLLQRKDQALQADDPQTAARLLEQYLHFVEDDLDARAELAMLSAEIAQTDAQQMKAFHRLEAILREDDTRQDVRHRLATLLMDMQRWNDAAVHFESLCHNKPDDPELQRNHALCLLSSGKFQQAADRLQEAIERFPDDVDAYEQLAVILRRELGRPTDAARIVKRLTDNNPSSVEAWLARARYQLFFGELERARISLQTARQLAPDHLEVNLLAAHVAASDPGSPQEELDSLRTQLETLSTAHPDEVQLYLLLARLPRRLGDTEASVTWLQRGLEAQPDATQLRTDLALLLIDLQRISEAQELLASHNDQEESPLYTYMWGRTDFAEGRWRQARDRFHELSLMPTLPDELANEVNLWLARSYEKLEQQEEAIAAYQRILSRTPAHNEARRRLLVLLKARGALSAAISNLEHAGQLAPAGAIVAARLKFDHERSLPPDARDWSEVEEAIRYAEKLAPRSADVALLKSALYEQRNDLPRAQQTLTEARQHAGDDLRLWLTEIRLLQIAGDADAADQLWTETQSRFAGHPDLLAARIRQTLTLSKDAAAQQLDAIEAELDGLTAPATARVIPVLTSVWGQLGEHDRALAAWESLEATDELKWHAQRFDLARAAANDSAVEETLQAIREIEGADGRYYRCLRAQHLIDRAAAGDRSGLREARQLVDELRSEMPDWSLAWITQARLQEVDNHRSAAIESYSHAFDLDPRNEPLVRKLLQLLVEDARYREAGQAIDTYERHTGLKLPPDMSILASRIAYQAGNTDRALEYARTNAALHRHHAPSQLWLGQLQSRTSSPDAAATLQRAIELDPTDGDAWVALVEHRVRSGEHDRIPADLRAAEQQLPAAEIPLTFARCYELLGQQERAETAYQTALSLHADDADVVLAAAEYFHRTGKSARARELLGMVLAPDYAATPQQRARARRVLTASAANNR